MNDDILYNNNATKGDILRKYYEINQWDRSQPMFDHLMKLISEPQYTTNPTKMTGETYLKGNPIVKRFIDELNDYLKQNLFIGYSPVTIDIGDKFISIAYSGRRWGFISRVDGVIKSDSTLMPLKKGDLMRAVDWYTPGEVCGNIAKGTIRYNQYGPILYNL